MGFKHGIHRASYTCRVCHFELNFAMTVHGTKIIEEKNRAGESCSACHNGRTAFGHRDENCLCTHSGNIGQTDHLFIEVKDFPKALSGDQINWVKALRQGLIRPKQSIVDEKYESIPFDKHLRLDPEWRWVKTRATLPHDKHTEWLDSGPCHPVLP